MPTPRSLAVSLVNRLGRVAPNSARHVNRVLARSTSDIVGAVDAPRFADMFGIDLALVGWAASRRGVPVRVRAAMEGLELCDVAASDTRVDVGTNRPGISSSCGFNTRILRPPLPDRDRYRLEVEAYTETSRRVIAAIDVAWLPQARLPSGRTDYRKVWNAVVSDTEGARCAVAGYTDDAEWRRTGLQNTETMRNRLAITPPDVVLEVGCGAARIGQHLRDHCTKWIGADVSANMLKAAREAVGDDPRVELVEITGHDLAPIASDSVDAAYCTVVFMHLEEWDRFRYCKEMFRVLRKGGRILVDNFDLLSDEGWAFFDDIARMPPELRPLNVSKSSTGAELGRYLEKAGFVDITIRSEGLFVSAVGHKPD